MKLNFVPKNIFLLSKSFETWISILRRTDYPHSDDPQNKAKLWQVPINFKGRKLFSRTKVIIIP